MVHQMVLPTLSYKSSVYLCLSILTAINCDARGLAVDQVKIPPTLYMYFFACNGIQIIQATFDLLLCD